MKKLQVACFAAAAAAATLIIILCAVFAPTAPNVGPHVSSIELAHVKVGIHFSSLSGRNGDDFATATAVSAASRVSQEELDSLSSRIFHKSQFTVHGSQMASAQLATAKRSLPVPLLDIRQRCNAEAEAVVTTQLLYRECFIVFSTNGLSHISSAAATNSSLSNLSL